MVNETLIKKREDLVQGLRRELRALIQEGGLTQRQLEEANGFTPRYLSQVLQGNITLTVRHLCGIVLALGMRPEELFSRVLGPPPGVPADELRERLERYDKALEQLEEQGLVKPSEP